VFARALSIETGIPMDAHLVVRTRNTTPQKELNEKARRENLKKAFQSVTNIVEYKRVLLVDDIYTTGSTIDAVAEVLLAAGVQSIFFICVSIGEGY
jgi:predicted amidophosphoribosyltransferase